jgi:hypothetical protein
MVCHDILVQTSITEASQEWIDRAEQFWASETQILGLKTPVGMRPYAGYDGKLSLSGLSGESAEVQASLVERYSQAYVASQIFAGLQADGYEMTANYLTNNEGIWVIEARDNSRNATIGVTLYRTLEFEIDFLDALHDDSVWLTGGEFGRVLEFLRRQGLAVEPVNIEIDPDRARAVSSALYA